MKKIILSFVMLFALASTATAQDTLLLFGPKGNYHYNEWPITPGDTMICGGFQGALAYYHYTQDTLKIYGIVASLEPEILGPYDIGYIVDTSLDKVSATLRLYKHTPLDMVYQLGENLFVEMAEPPTYYMKIDAIVEDWGVFVQSPVYAVYERYFDDPVTVTDSFYVGYDQLYLYNSSGHPMNRYVSTIEFKGLHDAVALNVPHMLYSGGYWDGNPTGWFFMGLHLYYPYLFPILTPLPDTTVMACDTLQVSGDTIIVRDTLIVGGGTMVVNGDTIVYYDTIVHYDTIIYTVGLQDNSLLGRLTGVMPNPAAETAKVVSSFGLTMVEAFNMAGEKVHTLRLPDAPLSATLDVRRWPSGTYLLRIHTPQGTAVKKLIVK